MSGIRGFHNNTELTAIAKSSEYATVVISKP